MHSTVQRKKNLVDVTGSEVRTGRLAGDGRKATITKITAFYN